MCPILGKKWKYFRQNRRFSPSKLTTCLWQDIYDLNENGQNYNNSERLRPAVRPEKFSVNTESTAGSSKEGPVHKTIVMKRIVGPYIR